MYCSLRGGESAEAWATICEDLAARGIRGPELCILDGWKGLRTTNAIERLYLEFRRRIKTQGSLPDEAVVLARLYGLLASGQIRFRKLDTWQGMAVALTAPLAQTDRAAKTHGPQLFEKLFPHHSGHHRESRITCV